MIYYFTSYSTNKNIGQYYNKCIESIGEQDYACFVDGDAMFSTHNWGHQISDIVNKYPDQHLFTCVTNRVGTEQQCVPGMWDEQRIDKHWQKGKEIQQKYYSKLEELLMPISGVLILIKKSLWLNMGKVLESGMLGVDNDFYNKAKAIGHKTMIMKGVYIIHYYRNGQRSNKSHLL